MKETSTVINYVKIGKKIKKIRLEKELTQEEIASAAEISLSHMSNIETAKTKVSLITLAKISRILECSLDELVFDDKITSNFKLKKNFMQCRWIWNKYNWSIDKSDWR